MRLLATVCLAGLLAITAMACKHNKQATTTVTQRASFDLACVADDLHLTVLDSEGARKLSSQIAVQGCGQQAVYIYYPESGTWIINGAVAPIEEGFELAPHVTKGKNKKRADKRAAKAEKKGGMNE